MKAVFSARPFARLASMNSTAALYSRGRSIVAGTVLLSTVASCTDGFLLVSALRRLLDSDYGAVQGSGR